MVGSRYEDPSKVLGMGRNENSPMPFAGDPNRSWFRRLFD